MIRARGALKRPERGAAAVEFALVVPILLLLTFGIISFGFMLSFRQSVSQAAAEGARAAAVAPAAADRSAIARAAVAQVMGVTCGSAYLTCTVTTPPTCAPCISVAVVYAYKADPSKPVFPGVAAVTPATLTYTAVSKIAP
jgi:Flp pilus assembly protein TadG